MYSTQDNVTETNVITVSNVSTNSSKESVDYEEINYIFWMITESFLFIVIVLVNVITILAIVWFRKLRRIVSNYFIVNLAVSDLLVAVTLPYHLMFYVDDAFNRNKIICMLHFVIFNLGYNGNLYCLIAVAFDRYFAILYPLRYNVYMTKKHVLLIIAVIWICTMCTSSIPIYWHQFDGSQMCEVKTLLPRYYILIVQIPMFLLGWVTIFLLYFKILKKANLHKHGTNLNILSKNVLRKVRRSVQMVLLILGYFSISWLFYFIILSIYSITFWRTYLMIMCYKSAYFLMMISSAINPFILAWNQNFRKAIHKILHFKSPNSSINSIFKAYFEEQRKLRNNRQQTNVRKDSRINETSNSRSSNRRSNHTGENRINSTNL